MKKLILSCIVVATPFAVRAERATPLLIQNVRIFDGERTIRKADVLIERGRIIRVGRRIDAASATRIDGTGKTLLPGLIDSHVHGFPGSAADALRFGVTTEDGTAIATDARVAAWLSPSQQETLTFRPKSMQAPDVLRQAIDTVSKLHGAGVVILAGTDAPNPGTAHGAAMPIELEYLVKSGMTPSEALKAATSLPARTWGMRDRGRIAAGYRADIVLVDGDPTRTIGDLRNISGVWKNGFAVDRAVPTRDPRSTESTGKK